MAEEKVMEFDDLDKELLRLKLEQPGRSNVELAALTKRAWRTIIRRTSRPEFQAALQEYQKKAVDLVMGAKTKAVRKIISLLNSKDENIALKAAIAIAADMLPGKKVAVSTNGKILLERVLTEEEVDQRIQEILQESGINSGVDKAVAELLAKG